MAYDELLADRIRSYFKESNIVFEEIKMMGGLCFMVDDKMCVGVMENKLMARLNKEKFEFYLNQSGAAPMDFTGRVLKGFLFIEDEGIDSEKALNYWLNEALLYNPIVKKSKKRRKKKS